MKDILSFVLATIFLFGVHFLLGDYGGVVVSYRIHFLIFFITFIGILSIILIEKFLKKGISGFLFLGFIILKLFAVVYIAMVEKEFKANILTYFVIYWIYLFFEIMLIIRQLRKK